MFIQHDQLPSSSSPAMRTKLLGIYGLIFTINVAAWLWVVVAFHAYPLLLGTALVAYGLGLRHAVDADHIAAIDNVTRKLIEEGKQPVAVGLYFSLGHSSIVVLATIVIAFAASIAEERFGAFREVGETIGTLVSTLFLFVLAGMNIVILRGIYRTRRRIRDGEPYIAEDFKSLLGKRGMLPRLFRSVFRLANQSWHMYPIGFLFGLGFDTATEIGLLGIAATQSAKGLPPGTILVFPLLFCAAMTLVDTIDSHLMVGAYRWARRTPLQTIHYNMTITFVSVVVAVFVGSIEGLGLLESEFNLKGPVWGLVSSLNENFGVLGYIIVGIFACCWAASVALRRARTANAP